MSMKNPIRIAQLLLFDSLSSVADAHAAEPPAAATDAQRRETASVFDGRVDGGLFRQQLLNMGTNG